MVIWIIGLAGSGKTTVSDIFYKQLKKDKKNTVLLDGDQIRQVFLNDLKHTEQDRRKNAKRIRNLCKMLDLQNINVVCSILSIAEKDRFWCRKNLSEYIEIYIKSDIRQIQERGDRKIYFDYDKGLIRNVVGKDITFEEPRKSDYIIDNSSTKKMLLKNTNNIIKDLLKKNVI